MKKRKPLKIIIGDQTFSSWSMRPWLVLHHSGLPFTQIKILLDHPDTKRRILRHSPSGRVPVLLDGGLTVWDSLAIAEYLAELAPNRQLWPSDPKLRARARAYAAEMHSGFASLRQECSMNLHLRVKATHMTAGAVADIHRVVAMWKGALREKHGDFLFGEFGIVDAFFAPVVTRFISYGIDIRDASVRAYMKRVMNHPSVQAWVAGAKKEKAFYLKF